MGADLIIASLVLDAGASPDFDAGLAAIDRLSAADVEDPDYFDADPETNAGLSEIRFRLAAELRELELALTRSREVEAISSPWCDRLPHRRHELGRPTNRGDRDRRPAKSGSRHPRRRRLRGRVTCSGEGTQLVSCPRRTQKTSEGTT